MWPRKSARGTSDPESREPSGDTAHRRFGATPVTRPRRSLAYTHTVNHAARDGPSTYHPGTKCYQAPMPLCGNCEGFVTEQYVRVFAPDDEPTVRVCPNCEDVIRDGADVREARSKRA